MRSSSPITSAVVFCVVIALLVVFRTGDSQSIGDVSFAATCPAEVIEGEGVLQLGPQLLERRAEAVERESAQLSARHMITAPAFSGFIVDEGGATVAGADILWVSLEGRCDPVRTSTGGGGQFEFPAIPSALTETWSALWVLHATHLVELLVLEPGGDARAAFGSVLELEGAHGFMAFTANAEGDPISEVSVDQFFELGSPPSLEEVITDRASAEERARAVFRHTTRSDSSGAALLLPLRGRSRLNASSGSARSVRWVGPSEGEAVLKLHESLEVLGRVHGATGRDAWVRCEGVSFEGVSLLGEFRVKESGAWGPASVPRLDVDEYVFTLRGDVAASQVRVPRDQASGRMVIDMECVHGMSFDLTILGSEDVPLAGANATAHWKQDGSWQVVGDSADREGRCRMRGVPEGAVFVRVRAEGHIAQMIGPLDVSGDMSPVVVRLLVAGRISGRCLRDGEPVEDFQLLYWSEDPSQVASEKVNASEDGSFLIAEAPIGEVTIIGIDEEVANGSPQLVVVSAGETTEVTIELPRPANAQGMVVDAVTGEAVVDARVQIMSAFEGHGLAEFGPEEPSDAGGHFILKGLPSTVGALRVIADGYITEFVVTHGRGDQEIDLGLIALQPSRELVVQLDGPNDMSYEGYRIGLVRHEHLGALEADHEGSVRFRDIPNGVIELNIYHPNDSVTAFAGSLQPEDDGRIIVPVSGGQRLYVQVRSDDADGLPLDLFVGVGGMRGDGSEVVHWLHDEGDGRFLFEAAQPGPAVVRAVNLRGDVYAIRRIEVPVAGDSEVELELDEEEDFTVRVVDAEERPVFNAMVRIYLPRTDPCFFVRELFTDSTGEARVHGFGFSHAQVTVTHELKGSGDLGLVDVGALGGAELLVRLDAPARLRVLVHDDGAPVAAAAAVLRAREPLVNGDGFGARTTARDGSAVWESLMQTDYELSVHGVGLWPSRRVITPNLNGDRQLIEVRRTGQLSLLIFDGRGRPISGVEVDLRLTGSGESVADWISEGLLPSSAALTDASGRLSLPPVPHGSWAWTVLTVDGRTGAGLIDLSPGETREVVGFVQ